jgi:hypothetical protein
MREITQNHKITSRPSHLVRLFNRKSYTAALKLSVNSQKWSGISFYLMPPLLNVLT